MGYHSFSRWPSQASPRGKRFAEAIEQLAYVLRASLEARVDEAMDWHNGSASLRQLRPNNWSKYKLVPYDERNMPPIGGLDEGALLCTDKETLDDALARDSSLRRHFDGLHPESLLYQVAGGSRSYRCIPFPLTEDPEFRFRRLLQIGRGIRLLESTQ